jgi:hypothetical protein
MAFVRHYVDPVRLVGEARFLKHDADLHAVGRRERKELQPIRVLRRPTRKNRMIECHLFHSSGECACCQRLHVDDLFKKAKQDCPRPVNTIGLCAKAAIGSG